jgi:hypothetical protein
MDGRVAIPRCPLLDGAERRVLGLTRTNESMSPLIRHQVRFQVNLDVRIRFFAGERLGAGRQEERVSIAPYREQ